ncbi:MAG: helix-turn-helix domain-containing protein [Sandaracinus sp.]
MRTRERPASARHVAATTAVIGPWLALSEARTAGVTLFERRPPLHSIVLGEGRLERDGSTRAFVAPIAVPAGARHRVELHSAFGCVAYLDPRRYDFAEVARLAERWRGFVPGRDDLREAFGDALRAERRRVDPRLLRAIDAMEHADADVVSAAARAGLSESRLAHLMTRELGPPPVAYRTWFKLRRAIEGALVAGLDLTEAAHAAGFADSAHLSRTCKHLLGVAPAAMLPPTVHRFDEE